MAAFAGHAPSADVEEEEEERRDLSDLPDFPEVLAAEIDALKSCLLREYSNTVQRLAVSSAQQDQRPAVLSSPLRGPGEGQTPREEPSPRPDEGLPDSLDLGGGGGTGAERVGPRIAGDGPMGLPAEDWYPCFGEDGWDDELDKDQGFSDDELSNSDDITGSFVHRSLSSADKSAMLKATMESVANQLVLRQEWDLSNAAPIQGLSSSMTLVDTMEAIDLQSAEFVRHLTLGDRGHPSNHYARGKSNACTMVFAGGPVGAKTLVSRLAFRIRDLFVETCMLVIPLDPQSKARLSWDLMGLCLVCYDAVVVPLILMVAHTDVFSSGMDWFLVLFWTLDIAASFLTATYVSSELKHKLKDIAYHYTRTWLCPDVLMVLPDWISLAIGAHSWKAVRFIRLFRALRLLRLIKMNTVLQDQLRRVNSLVVLNLFRLSQLLFLLLMVNHILACCWYLIGYSFEDGWLDSTDDFDSDWTHGYLVALHWSITQFHGSMEVNPKNRAERVFAVVVLVFGMITFSSFVSVITDMILQVRHFRKRKTEQRQQLRNYFQRHNISPQLMIGVKRYMEYHTDRDKEFVEDKELLKALPAMLQKSVLLEARAPIMVNHRLMSWIWHQHASAFRELCHSGVTAMRVQAGHCVFNTNDSWQQMLFLECGCLNYVRIGKERQPSQHRHVRTSQMIRQVQRLRIGAKLAPRDWICEPACWLQNWQTVGELLVISDSNILSLNADRFAKILSGFRSAHIDAGLYARWALQELRELAEEGELSDMWHADTARLWLSLPQASKSSDRSNDETS